MELFKQKYFDFGPQQNNNLQTCTEIWLIEHILSWLSHADADRVVADLLIEMLGVLPS